MGTSIPPAALPATWQATLLVVVPAPPASFDEHSLGVCMQSFAACSSCHITLCRYVLGFRTSRFAIFVALFDVQLSFHMLAVPTKCHQK